MRDIDKTKEQLINELEEMRQRVTELEESEADNRRASLQLKQEKEQLEAILDVIPGMVFHKDINDRLLRCNKNFALTLGMSREEVEGKTTDELFPEEAEDMKRDDQEVIKSGQPKTRIGESYSTPQGVRWAQTDKVPYRDKNGRVVGLIGVATDITERKWVERDLNERVKELQCLYDIAQIVETPDITLGELYQEVTNLLPASWQHPEIACARTTINGKRFKTQNFRYTELRQSSDIKVDGAKVGVVEVCYLGERPEISEDPFLEEERQLIDAVAERLGKITKRKQLEAALQENKERLDSFMDSATDGFILFDSKLNYVDINEVALGMIGLGKEEVIGKNILDIMPDLKETGRYDRYMEVIKTGHSFFIDDVIPNTKFGDINLAVRAFKVGDGLGIITTDITERKRLDQLKDDFIGLVSHELRSPLTVITGAVNTALTEGERLSPEETRQLLQDAASEAESLSNMLGNLLELSRVQADRLFLHAEATNAKKVIQDTVERIKRQSSSRQFVVDVPRKLPSVYADELRLERVLYNLLENAAKYSPQGGGDTSLHQAGGGAPGYRR